MGGVPKSRQQDHPIGTFRTRLSRTIVISRQPREIWLQDCHHMIRPPDAAWRGWQSPWTRSPCGALRPRTPGTPLARAGDSCRPHGRGTLRPGPCLPIKAHPVHTNQTEPGSPQVEVRERDHRRQPPCLGCPGQAPWRAPAILPHHSLLNAYAECRQRPGTMLLLPSGDGRSESCLLRYARLAWSCR